MMFANGDWMHLDAPAQIINGRTMLPLRAPLEVVGIPLDWDEASRTIIVGDAGNFVLPAPVGAPDVVEGEIAVFVDGNRVSFEGQQPMVIEGIVFVPVRGLV